ncbi:MFS transporter [Streptomyces sp. NPDC088921]|uniref:MFS transporter n=1 Tax=unclassified Streptomyces TaxID=2593676 RepID=UPI0034318AE6
MSDRQTEANALLGSGYNLGSALGSSLAGILLTAAGVHTTLAALAIAAALGAFAVVLLPKRAAGLRAAWQQKAA